MTENRRRVLLLGGTADARAIAKRLKNGVSVDVIYSLAGRTKAPILPDLESRSGGFGGSAGLASYLTSHAIDFVIDATHPFAIQMSTNAKKACDQVDIPLLRFDRPAWLATAEDTWTHVETIAAAAQAAPELGRRILLTTGRQELSPFLKQTVCWWLVRVVEANADLPALNNGNYVFGRGPFDKEAELTLLKNHQIDLVISKNSGGLSTYGKIAAARELNLPVIMIDRPAQPLTSTAKTYDEVVNWLVDHP